MPSRFLRTWIVWTVLCTALSAPGAALAGSGGTLTPERSVELALASHPMIVAADRDVEGAEADRDVARSGYLPRIDLTEDWMRSTNPVFVFASKLGQESFGATDFALDSLNRPDAFTNAATRISVRQNVWDGGRTILYGKAAKLGVEAATLSRVRTREQIAFGALRAFWDAVLAERMLDVARAAEEAAKANADLARHQEEGGLAVPSDRMSAEVRLAEVRAMRIRAEQGTIVARAALRQALGLREDVEFVLDPPDVEPDAPQGDPDGAVERGLSARSDLRAMDARLAQADAGEKMARSGWMPEIGVAGQYEWNGTNLLGHEGSNWSVGLSVRIPVFEGLESVARTARARADRGRIQAYRDAMAEGVRLEVRSAWADRIAAAERVLVAESALASAEESLRMVRERYAEGMAVMVELLGAEAAQTAARFGHAVAYRDLVLASAALDLATGQGTAVSSGEESAR